MSIAAAASLYQERTGQVTSRDVIDRCLNDLVRGQRSLARYSAGKAASSWPRRAWTA